MHFTCKYASGTEFGTGGRTTDYLASVNSKNNQVMITFKFRSPPQGKSNPNVTNAKIDSLFIALSQKEALQLAASIIAQAHHPMIHDSVSKWIPPEFMPALAKNQWSRTVDFSFKSWNNEVLLHNKSRYHLGKVTIKLTYKIHDAEKSEFEFTEIVKTVDLPTQQQTVVRVSEMDIPFHHRRKFSKITSVELIGITGVNPEEVR